MRRCDSAASRLYRDDPLAQIECERDPLALAIAPGLG